MTWSLIAPNLLIGLREGLEAGLVVTILLGAVRKLAPERSLAGVWLGVASAIAVSFSFGAILTFTRAELSPRAQEIFGGVTSLIAVVLVTTMVFWMRKAARSVAGELRGKVGRALAAGGPALAITAFIAVAREGLETALFVWTNAQAAGSTRAPLIGAVIGLAIAAVLCALLYRHVLKINLGRFFTITGGILLVIVAGVFSYGIGDLQDAGVVPGHANIAFDISNHVPNGSWWAETIRGITNLDTRMTWLQVGAYVGYLAVTFPLFLRHIRPVEKPAPAPASSTPAAVVDKPRRTMPRRRIAAIAGGVALPVVVAGTWVAVDGGHQGKTDTALTVTSSDCASGWSAPKAGHTTYAITNSSGHAVDIELVHADTKAVIAEIEVLGPGTTRPLPVTLSGGGNVAWQCIYDGLPQRVSAAAAVRGEDTGADTRAIPRTTDADLAPVLTKYRAFVGSQLATLKTQVAVLQRTVASGDRASAQRDWLAAHLTYHRIGAAYDAFGAAGDAVDGLAQGLPNGVHDTGFVGFHKIELDLWSGRSMAAIAPAVADLRTAVDNLDAKLPKFTFDANDVTIRAHEILEDTLRFTLTGEDDYGSGSGFATEHADLDGDRVLVQLLAPLLEQRSPGITKTIYADMDRLRTVLGATGNVAVGKAPLAVRQRVNAATSQLLEDLAPVPDLLEIRAS